mmetsp:Transcript_7065/g.14670  ORF Transcript_7065/g.14670 Transcript_7065/m.14670 type:complete len:306 (-) Transcript_7065:19-936(-)
MDNPRMSELMEALLFASFFATPRHLYVGGGETTPDAGSTAHLALYAASAFVICTLIYKLVSSLSWLNPPAARGPHREAAATAAERRAASQHHRTPAAVTAPARDCPPAAQGSHFREAAATVAERRAASQPPSPHHTKAAHHTTTVATPAQHRPQTAQPTTNSQGALAAPPHPRRCHRPRLRLGGRLGGLWAGAPLRARTQAQARTRKRRRCEEKEELVCYLVTHAQVMAHTSSPASSVHTVGGACTEARSSMLILGGWSYLGVTAEFFLLFIMKQPPAISNTAAATTTTMIIVGSSSSSSSSSSS